MCCWISSYVSVPKPRTRPSRHCTLTAVTSSTSPLPSVVGKLLIFCSPSPSADYLPTALFSYFNKSTTSVGISFRSHLFPLFFVQFLYRQLIHPPFRYSLHTQIAFHPRLSASGFRFEFLWIWDVAPSIWLLPHILNFVNPSYIRLFCSLENQTVLDPGPIFSRRSNFR